ncbi:MAG: hypothetical protein KGL39_42440 [Patescibacteria group bacterium]|nr:hypothetical protein [Patescibacteria group bacterium]
MYDENAPASVWRVLLYGLGWIVIICLPGLLWYVFGHDWWGGVLDGIVVGIVVTLYVQAGFRWSDH